LSESSSSEVARRAAFLDRDGTIVEDVGFLRDASGLRLLPGAAEGIRLLREAGFLAIVVTNQSGIARGYLTEGRLAEIHRALEEKLRERGTELDAVYYCPHLAGAEVSRYSRECDCRKPLPGLLVRAAREWNVKLSTSVAIGDSERDVLAGRRAGCLSVLIAKEHPGQTEADLVVESLLEVGRLAAGGALRG